MKYKQTFINPKWYYKLGTICILGFAIYFLYIILKSVSLGMKYPKELFELINVTFSESVRSGNNPFSRNSIVTPGELPPVVYEYPFFNSFAAIAFSVFTGGNLFAAHYLVSVLCIIGTGIIGTSFVKKYAVTTVGPAFIKGYLFYPETCFPDLISCR